MSVICYEWTVLVRVCDGVRLSLVYITGAQITILRENASSPPSTAVT